MLTGTFVLLVVTAMLVHYFFVDRPAEARARAARPRPRPIALADAVNGLPEEVFLQPTFTWTRMRENGEIFLGLHPMLTSLVGIDYSLELVADDAEIELGTPLLRIRRGERELQVFSPVDGVVVEGNTDFTPLPGWKGSTIRGGSWVYRIRPRRLERETPGWLKGEAAGRWAHQKYREVRDFLFQTEVHQDVGLAAADGGELPSGVLSHLDPEAWNGFQETFLHPRNETGGE
jgi:glycine cleavage system H lipoate-binding protein